MVVLKKAASEHGSRKRVISKSPAPNIGNCRASKTWSTARRWAP